MTHQESQELKTYLEQQFGEVRDRFAKVDERFDGMGRRFDGIDQRLDGIDGRLDGIDGRLDGVDQRLEGIGQRLAGVDQRLAGIDTHLDRQDIDFNNTTMNLLRTIDDATKQSRAHAVRLFGILDRPALDTEDVPTPARLRRPTRPRARSGR